MSALLRRSMRALAFANRLFSPTVTPACSKSSLYNQRVCLINVSGSSRRFASSKSEEPVMNLSTVEVLEEGKKGVQIIDVRELVEIHDTGLIPGSVNIPLGHLEEAMKMSPEEFKERYGVNQPEKNNKLILSCRSGARSKRAILALQGLGYTNLYNNGEGWLGYEEYLKENGQK